jgi:hypothetical protein
MLGKILSTNVDSFFSIIQNLDDLSFIGGLACVSRSMRNALIDSEQGRLLWLNNAIRLTAGVEWFDAAQIRSTFESVTSKEEFFQRIRLLICPWHIKGVSLPVEIGSSLGSTQSLFLSDDGNRLSFQSSDSEHRISFPSRPCVGFESKIQFFDAKVDSLPVPAQDPLAARVSEKKVVPDFSHDKGGKYDFFSVHAGAFAVTEVHTQVFDHCAEVSSHGVYFFSRRDGRMLRHILSDDFSQYIERQIISRPMELWIMRCGSVDYFGFPSSQPLPTNFFRDSNICERLDPAFWMAGRGDMQSAIDFIRTKGVPLESKCLVGFRTLMHYAAMEGHADGVRLLLEEGFMDVDAGDIHGRTALHVAVAELHLDAVEVLLKEGGADVIHEDQGSCLGEIGDFVKYRPYSGLKDRVDDEINRIVPEIVRLLLEDDPSAVNCINSFIEQESILSSPEAVRLICKSEHAEPDLCNIARGYCNFRSRFHELSAIESLRVLVREFDLDINAPGEESDDENVIVSLVEQGCAEVVIMAIDNLGADPKTKNKNGDSIRAIAERRTDVDGRRIVAFFNSRGF